MSSIDAARSNDYFDRAFTDSQVMTILRGLPPGETVRLCRLGWSMGINTVEVPVQSAMAVASLEAAVAAGREQGRQVGAGTVTSRDRVLAAAAAGAAFTVAPGYSSVVADASLEAGLPHLPGVATSTEIMAVLDKELLWLKAFPAAQLGPGWFRAQLGPFPGLRLVATGGMDGDNVEEFLSHGARVVAVGTAFADPRNQQRLGGLAKRAAAIDEESST